MVYGVFFTGTYCFFSPISSTVFQKKCRASWRLSHIVDLRPAEMNIANFFVLFGPTLDTSPKKKVTPRLPFSSKRVVQNAKRTIRLDRKNNDKTVFTVSPSNLLIPWHIPVSKIEVLCEAVVVLARLHDPINSRSAELQRPLQGTKIGQALLG